MFIKDYYKILGITKEASEDQIKSVYRTLAKDTHPDKHPNDPSAEARFKEIAEAYETLSDKKKKAEYDNSHRPESQFNDFSQNDHVRDAFNKFEKEYENFGTANRNNEMHSPKLDVIHEERISFDDIFKDSREFSISYEQRYDNLNTSRNNITSRTLKFSIDANSQLDISFDRDHGEYYIEKIFEKKGHIEDFSIFVGYGKGASTTKVYGNVKCKLWLDMQPNVFIDNSKIIQIVDVSLYDLLFNDEIVLEMVTGKKGKVKLNSYSYFTKLQVPIKGMGLVMNSSGDRGDYIFEFRIPKIDLEKLSDKDRAKFKTLLNKMT